MSENPDYHLWQPSVVSIHNPDGINEYTGNILIGSNLTKTDVMNLIRDDAQQYIQAVDVAGDEWIDRIVTGVSPYNQFTAILSQTSADMRRVLESLFGKRTSEESTFELNMSSLDHDHLG